MVSTWSEHDVFEVRFEDEHRDLHERLKALREQGPIAPMRFMGEDCWIILTYAGIHEGLRDDVTLPVRPYYEEITEPAVGRSIMTMEGAEHIRNRRLLSPSFRKGTVSRYIEPIVAPTCHELIDSFEGRREVDLVAEFTHTLPMIVTTKLLGLPPHEYTTLERWANQLFSFGFDPAGALRARHEFTEFLKDAVDERRAERRDDLISRLVDAQEEDDGLTDDEVHSFIRLLFPAGVHNTANALGNTIWALLTQTDDGFERVRTEDDAAHWAVEETLRWENPLAVLPRRAAIERDWYGTTVPAGSLVVLSQAAAHRDPAAYPDPDRFDLDRHPENLLVLGLGAHFCIGAALARQEVRVAIEVLAARCRGLRLVDPEQDCPVGGAQRGPRALRVEIDW